MKNEEKIRKWVYMQIEKWAQDNYESAESWSRCRQDQKNAEAACLNFIKVKKLEFDKLLK